LQRGNEGHRTRRVHSRDSAGLPGQTHACRRRGRRCRACRRQVLDRGERRHNRP
jgi:hypothetical protein